MGDAHTSQACALVAFSNYDFISQSKFIIAIMLLSFIIINHCCRHC